MSKRGLFSVALKVFGIVLLTQGIVSIPSTVASVISMLGPMNPTRIGMGSTALYVGVTIAVPALMLVMGVVLLGAADGLARRFACEDEAMAIPAPDSWQRPVFALAARLIGLYYVCKSVPYFVQVVGDVVTKSKDAAEQYGTTLAGGFREGVWPTDWPSIIYATLFLAISVYLITGAPRLVTALFGPHEEPLDEEQFPDLGPAGETP